MIPAILALLFLWHSFCAVAAEPKPSNPATQAAVGSAGKSVERKAPPQLSKTNSLKGPTARRDGLAPLTKSLDSKAVPNTPAPSELSDPPAVRREFRGLWVATVGNIDWPSKSGLPASKQQAELVALLDKAVAMRLNAVLLQVRPSCDALYRSDLEPWSEYLSGTMGVAPSPEYDPLEFAVREAHQRGLEFHAWFNPFRARFALARSPSAASHVTKTHPEWIRHYGNLDWLDPGLPQAQDYSLSVVQDVLQRYDVDAIHIDDYFYPYPDASLKNPEFPDKTTYDAYRSLGGDLSRSDWRRNNVNLFVESLYRMVKRHKPWVKVGISPFGIWRPDNPRGIRGLDAYESLAADARLWLQKGWLDYAAPQLYWSADSKEQNFQALLRWWTEQNPLNRHMWPGMATANLSKNWKPEEISRQISLTRAQKGCTGHLHWGANVLFNPSNPFDQWLRNQSYPDAALVPASPWLNKEVPAAPNVVVNTNKGRWTLTWSAPPEDISPSHWVVQVGWGDAWTTRILPGATMKYLIPQRAQKTAPVAVSITAVSRTGIASQAEIRSLLPNSNVNASQD